MYRYKKVSCLKNGFFPWWMKDFHLMQVKHRESEREKAKCIYIDWSCIHTGISMSGEWLLFVMSAVSWHSWIWKSERKKQYIYIHVFDMCVHRYIMSEGWFVFVMIARIPVGAGETLWERERERAICIYIHVFDMCIHRYIMYEGWFVFVMIERIPVGAGETLRERERDGESNMYIHTRIWHVYT